MQIEKQTIEKVVIGLMAKAEACFKGAEAQHRNAEKLVVLGQELEADAAKLNGEIELIAARPGHKAPASDH